MTDARAAWNSFWTGPGGGQGGGRGGCLPRAEATHKVLRDLWRRFAAGLPRKAMVLDLATGNGLVLAQLGEARPDLQLTGVDYAGTLPRPPRRMRLLAGVSLEALPFEPGRFDAGVSQFGFEYAARDQAAAELGRVLRPAAPVLLVVHHQEGSLLADNLARRAGIDWLIGEQLFEAAAALVRARRAMPLPTPSRFAELVAEARRRFPDDPLPGDVARAVLDTLQLGRTAGPQATEMALRTVRGRVEEERKLIDALAGAACGPEGIAGLCAALGAAGIATDEPAPIAGPSGPFAWRVTGRRTG